MSDTPRTDRFIEQGYVLSGHARQLERELAAMTEARDKALEALKAVADCRSADEAHDIIVNQFPDLIEELEEVET